MNCEVLLHGVHVDIDVQKREPSFLSKAEVIFWWQTFTWVKSNPEVRLTNSHRSSDCHYVLY